MRYKQVSKEMNHYLKYNGSNYTRKFKLYMKHCARIVPGIDCEDIDSICHNMWNDRDIDWSKYPEIDLIEREHFRMLCDEIKQNVICSIL
jgi:hypothetical protein